MFPATESRTPTPSTTSPGSGTVTSPTCSPTTGSPACRSGRSTTTRPPRRTKSSSKSVSWLVDAVTTSPCLDYAGTSRSPFYFDSCDLSVGPVGLIEKTKFQATSSRSLRMRTSRAGARGARTDASDSTPPTTSSSSSASSVTSVASEAVATYVNVASSNRFEADWSGREEECRNRKRT